MQQGPEAQEGTRRKLARLVQPKGLLQHDVADTIRSLSAESPSLADIRFVVILLVGYAGVLSISKILSCRVKDFTTFDHFIYIFLVKRRMVSLETGAFQSLLYHSPKLTRPVKTMTEKLLSLLPDPRGSSHSVVRRIVNSKFTQDWGKISYFLQI